MTPKPYDTKRPAPCALRPAPHVETYNLMDVPPFWQGLWGYYYWAMQKKFCLIIVMHKGGAMK